MQGFLLVIGCTFCLSIGMTATGWAIGELAHVRALRGRRLEAWIGRAFLGAGCWVLFFGLLSHLGASVRGCRAPLAWMMLAGVVCALLLNRSRWRIRRPGAIVIVFAIACQLSLLLANWPLVHCAAVWPFNDTLAYCSISHWLQDHGFGSAVAIDPDLPATRFVNEFQVRHWRMGSTFLLALVQGYTGLDPLLAFPIVTGWGMLLNLGGIFLLARWGLRLNRWMAVGASVCAAAALNPLYTSIHQGFQPQLFGTAYLLAALSVLCRARRPAFWSPGNALFLAAITATLVSVYSEMTPILAIVALAYSCWMLARSSDRRRWLPFAGWTVLFLALLGNLEWYRAACAVNTAVGVAVGYRISWSDFEYLGFALGQLHFHHRDPHVQSRLIVIVIAGMLLMLGMARAIRERRFVLPTIGLFVCIGMALWFRFGAVDPRTGEIGHHWSLFKVAKWAFPLLLVFQFAGLAILLRRWRLRPSLALLPALFALGMSYTYHREYNQWAGHAMRDLTGSANPTEDWRRLREELDRRGIATIYLEHPGCMRQVHVLMPNALYPRRFVNGWKGSELEEIRSTDGAVPPRTAVLAIGPGLGESLPGNVTLVNTLPPAPAATIAAADRGTASGQNSTSR
jgi:hypothetical protein